MPSHALVPDPNRLDVLSLTAEGETIFLTARTCGESARCPICGQPSSRVHSQYHRTLADLPMSRRSLPASRCGRGASFATCPTVRAASSPSDCQALRLPMRVARIACATGCGRWPSRWAASRGHSCCDSSASRCAATPCSHASARMRPPLSPRRACSAWTTLVRHEVAEVAVPPSKGGIVPGVLPPVPYQAESSAPGTM
jgi:hypothetical protein